MPGSGQKLRFDPLPATSGLPRIPDIHGPIRLVRLEETCRHHVPFFNGFATSRALSINKLRDWAQRPILQGDDTVWLHPIGCGLRWRRYGPAGAVRCRTAGRTLRPTSSMLARISSWPIPGQLTRIERWLMPQRCWATSISMTLAGAPTANRLGASARNCCSGAAFGSRVSRSKPHDT